MEDELIAQVRKALASWHGEPGPIKVAKEIADQHPAFATPMFFRTGLGFYRDAKRSLRDRFGIEESAPDKIEIVDPRLVPRSISQAISVYNGEVDASSIEPPLQVDRAFLECMATLLWCVAWRWVCLHFIRVKRTTGDRAACEFALTVPRFIMLAVCDVGLELPWGRAARQEAVAYLSAWVASQLSLQYGRLRAALKDGTGTPFENLLRELPGATLIEWADGGAEEIGDLRNRVAKRLTQSADESKHLLERGGKLAESETDPALENFELRETMRQQLEQLDRLEREAGLSQREMEVCRRHRQGMEEVEIAADLNITRNNDYVIKRNAIRRLTEARKAAGF